MKKDKKKADQFGICCIDGIGIYCYAEVNCIKCIRFMLDSHLDYLNTNLYKMFPQGRTLHI